MDMDGWIVVIGTIAGDDPISMRMLDNSQDNPRRMVVLFEPWISHYIQARLEESIVEVVYELYY